MLYVFVKGDEMLARKVLKDDDAVDELNKQLFRELLSFVSRYIEWIADHATNVVELIVYLVEGKIIHHTRPLQPN
ncbi:MAG: PhoU domain-containing protein [Nitrospirota bacterium]|nr:PhoU domain-containing protein [Nitrospirota bacterium]